jgi:hypothetical protein
MARHWEGTLNYVDPQPSTPGLVLGLSAGPGGRFSALAASALASPMTHLQQVRLEQAHPDLQVADCAATDPVAANARRWVIAKLCNSASIYRRRQGFRPNHTLAADPSLR